MMPFHTKTYISFMLNQEEYFSNSVRHAEGGTVVPVRSTDQSVARSSPTQRKYFVCNYCLAGARPLFQFIIKYLYYQIVRKCSGSLKKYSLCYFFDNGKYSYRKRCG